MANIIGLWRWKNTIATIPEDIEYMIIPGACIVNGQYYITSTIEKNIETQVITIKLFENQTKFIEAYSSDTGWLNQFLRIWDFKEEVSVSDNVYSFFTSSTEQIEPITSTTISYQNEKLISLEAGKTATLNCHNKVMRSNIEVAAAPLEFREVTPTKETQPVFPVYGYGGFHSLTVSPIPEEYIIPTGSKIITKNDTYDITSFSEVEVNVPIPEGYLKPEGHLKLEENVEELDISKYATLTVNAMKAIIGKEYECIAGTDITMGNFVEFIINYGQGEFFNQTVSDIHVYAVDQEKVLIDYRLSTGQRQVVGLYLRGDMFYLSTPCSYGNENVYLYDFVVLDYDTAVCSWSIRNNIGEDQEQSSVYIQAFQIETSYQEGIQLTPRAQNLVYTSNPGSEIQGMAISSLDYNKVFITLAENSNNNLVHYSVVKNLTSLGSWTTGIAGNVGYDYSNNLSLTQLSYDKVLCAWTQDNTFNCGIITIDDSESEILSHEIQILEDVSWFKIKDLNNGYFFPLLTKNINNKAEIQTLIIGGTSITLSNSIVIAENVSGPINLGGITSYETVVLYPHIQKHLTAKFFTHNWDGVSQLVSADTTSLVNLFVQGSFDIQPLSYYNNIIAYTDQTGASRYASLATTYSASSNTYLIKMKENETGTYVYPTTSNTALVGVAITNSKLGEKVTVVRPS